MCHDMWTAWDPGRALLKAVIGHARLYSGCGWKAAGGRSADNHSTVGSLSVEMSTGVAKKKTARASCVDDVEGGGVV